jgi:hypothetical protein
MCFVPGLRTVWLQYIIITPSRIQTQGLEIYYNLEITTREIRQELFAEHFCGRRGKVNYNNNI